ncbi:cysteine synthase A [Actinopolyspora biskrensis]|uniref:Cysteine synthase A n=1 Tax=Actinopolyspora biskrensis TaxID=1470178 RepID=A0A852Z0M6_9ACTN|nr:cysteine synthase A [Actinopolyspora biskrensis]
MNGNADSAGGRRCRSLLELIGDTPVLRVTTPLPEEHPGFWAKLEGVSPGGMKARAALSMIRGARRRGELRPGGTIVESTSGTLGIGLGYVGIALGHPVILVADRELDDPSASLLRAHGARIEVVDEPAPVGGWQRARRDRVARILAEHPDAFWPDQYNNPDNAAGYTALGRELLEQFDRLDAVVCSVGTGGHSSGIASVLRSHRPGVRLVGVDSPGSALFGPEPLPRVMRGLGSSIHPDNVAYEEFDEVHWIGPAEAAWACRELAGSVFVTGGWSTGAVALAAAWCSAELDSDRVTAVFPDGPYRYWHTVYDEEFRARNALEAPPCVRPHPYRADEARGWSRTRRVEDPCPERTGDSECPVCGRDGARS